VGRTGGLSDDDVQAVLSFLRKLPAAERQRRPVLNMWGQGDAQGGVTCAPIGVRPSVQHVLAQFEKVRTGRPITHLRTSRACTFCACECAPSAGDHACACVSGGLAAGPERVHSVSAIRGGHRAGDGRGSCRPRGRRPREAQKPAGQKTPTGGAHGHWRGGRVVSSSWQPCTPC
jgi:hypothetical protein